MILHHQFYFLFSVILISSQLIRFTSCKKEKLTGDYQVDYEDDFSSIYPKQNSWSVSFPKNNVQKLHDVSYEDDSREKSYDQKGYDDDDDEFYEKPNDDVKKPYYKPYKNDYSFSNKKPYEDDYDTSSHVYDHHDYDNFDTTLKKPSQDDHSDHKKNPLKYETYPTANKKPLKYNSQLNDRPNLNSEYETNYNQKPQSYYNNKYGNKPNDDDKYNKKPHSKPFDKPFNRPFNKPFDDKFYDDKPFSKPFDEPYDDDKPHSKPFNKPYNPFDEPFDDKPYNKPHNKPYDDKPYNKKPNNQQFSKPNKLNCYDKEDTCIALHKCPIYLRFDDYNLVQKCTLLNGLDGVCCPPKELPSEREKYGEAAINLPISQKATKIIYPKNLRYFPNVNRNQFRSMSDYDDYDERVKLIKKIEHALTHRHLSSAKNSPEMAHHNFFGYNKEANRLNRKGEYSLHRAINIAKQYFKKIIPGQKVGELMASFTTNIEKNATECLKEPVCKISRYRSPDGTCNNRFHPLYGKALSPYNRVLNPNYGDGINSPKLSKSKQELPNVRELSVELTRHKNPPSSKLTLVTMQFGQLIDHDIASAAPTRTEKGIPISCCRPEIQADPQNLKHPACFEISVSKNDPFYSEFNLTCMNFVRSAATPRADCRLAPREQLNQPTSFIDGSQIYGSSLETQLNLRAFSGGRLLSSLVNNNQFLPKQTNGTCNIPGNDPQKCFRAGDPRVNENIDLTVMQTIFLREHNRIANELEQLNPNWSDETIYQETKAIISAILQHITYNEFLPSVLNRQTMKQFDLYPNEEGFSNRYDSKINPTLFNAFATAGYRWHSSIRGSLQLRNNKDEIIGEMPLSNTFNNPTFLVKKHMLDYLINGMTSQSMQEIDQFFTGEVTNKLFRPWNSTFGLDIFSLNVQRGRDHGLKGYPAWRKQCGLENVKKFDDLDIAMPKNLVNTMKRFYSSVHDIDLYIAGILENHLPNSELGATFSCIVAEQFRRLKFGDRWWYENSGQVHSFTEDQLTEIKKVTMARLFCDNGDHIEKMQPFAFLLPKFWFNKKVNCQNLDLMPRINLTPWL